MVGSANASLYSSVSAGICALWGPLHGGANQEVIEMLEAIKADGGDSKKWIEKAKDKNDPFRLMGFGHRVYKNFDPRAKIIKSACDTILKDLGIEDPILNIAKELEEAAFIDGCNRCQMFVKIFFPVSRPAFASVSIFVFLWSYNDLFSALIFVNKESVRPIVALLNEISSQYGTDFGLMATAVALTVIPVLIVYLFISKFIEKGLTEGAIKG